MDPNDEKRLVCVCVCVCVCVRACVCVYSAIYMRYVSIKTHDSESRGQEEAAVHNDRVSYLHVASHSNLQTL